MFLFAENTTSQSLIVGNPWEFVVTETITAQIRGNKEDRQSWYQNPATKHCFYTGIEPTNPNIRPSKENPPHKIHALSADYDARIPADRVAEAIAGMKIKPQWVERSLGGNVRLVWIFSQPMLVDDYGFCAFILERAIKWLQLDMLPALDEPAFQAPSRLLCNGCDWKPTGFPPVPMVALQPFFVDAGRKFRFTPANESDIPLDVAEKECQRLFPAMNWPGEFAIEAQGPSFWIPESTTPLSAIIKDTGIFTFSGHAAKPFYSWADILGAEFVKAFNALSITKATNDIWWDSKQFWRRFNGNYDHSGEKEMANYFRVSCSLSTKPGKDGVSPLDVALNHIYNTNRVKAAVPFVFRPSGPITFMGERMLNTYTNRALQPAAETQHWGAQGNFPFMSEWFDHLFNPPTQLPMFMAWFQHYYLCAVHQVPQPGQNVFLMGGVGIGKTFLNRHVVGTAVGGYVDASDYLVGEVQFNSHLMHAPHWCLDDDTPANSAAANAKLHAVFKKTAANQQFLSNEKFQVSGMTEWMGRIGCTTNLDHVSSRIVGPMDNSSLDKTCLFKCAAESKVIFPARPVFAALIVKELPYFLRWLLDWVAPDHIQRVSRYGFASFQEPSLLDQSHQSNPMAPFKELLIESLYEWFAQNKADRQWCGTVSQLMRMLMSNPMNDYVMRSIKLEQTHRYLEQIQKEGLLVCTTDTGPLKTRIWKFENPNPPETLPVPAPAPSPVPIFNAQ